MTQEKNHSDTASQVPKNYFSTQETWAAMTRLHRLLQLGGTESTRAELVTQINALFKRRLGLARLRIDFTFANGLTVYCGSVELVPPFFKNKARHVFVVDQDWNVVGTWIGAQSP